MKVSLNWLADYVNLDGLTPEQVATAFTDIGLEVEGIHKESAFTGDVVVGQILTAQKHPNADSLRVCKVEVGEAEPLDIVCGAPNARAGIKVVVAKSGATLPGDFKIKKSKIRGEVSNGMMCSEQELQLGDSHDGIIELPEDTKIGESAAKALGLGDVVLELNVTPNRPDALGYVGLARDLAAKLKRPLRSPQLDSLVRDKGTKSEGHVTVRISDKDGCARFVALYVKDVAPVPSPAWMQKRLTASGMRPLNLLVDATNYAMLEFSQPVHAYDERAVAGRVLEVRAAAAGETLKTLDGQVRQLESGDLLICDADGPVGLAGIMGGENSEVKDDTKNVIIEVASFLPSRVRRTSKRLGLKSEASHRFERGVDVDNLPTVALRVADLIQKGLAEHGSPAAKVAVDEVDCYPADIQKRVVAMRVSHAKLFLGLQGLAKDDVVELLSLLGFDLLDSTDDRLLFEVPYFRPDIEREVDLIEEVGRINGFDRVPYQLPVMSLRPTPEDPMVEFMEQARTALAAVGLRETVTFPFVAGSEMQALGVQPGHPLYPTLSLANPLSATHDLMTTTLLPGLLKALAGNRRHGEKGARLFEVGRGFFDPAALKDRLGAHPALRGLGKQSRFLSRKGRSDEGRPAERLWIAAALDQPFHQKGWDTPATAAGFFHGKASVLALLRAFGLDGAATFKPVTPADHPFLHPGAGASITLAGKLAGYVGELHPRAAAAFDVGEGGSPVVFELDLEVVFDAKGKEKRGSAELRRFPPVTRDLALMVDKSKTHADLEAAVAKFKAKKHLSGFSLFDVYEGENLPAGKKSLAYSLTFQSSERTLNDQEVEAEKAALVAWLGESVQATQR